MSTLGVSPTTLNLLKGYGTTGPYTFNAANNMITVLSYIDITRGWEWMHALRKLQTDIEGSAFSGNVQIIAVVFNRYYYDSTVQETWGIDTFSGNISREWIEGKIDYDTALSGISFTVLVDDLWTIPSPAAINIIDDYTGTVSSPLPDPGTFWFAGLVDKNFRVSDKWEYNTTPSSRVTSFDHIAGTGFTSFQSNNITNDYANARAFIMKRIKNLIDPLYIIDTHPGAGAAVNTLNQSKIFFSKPVNSTEAQNVNNYTLNGGGFTGVEHPSSAVSNPVSNAENASTLTIPGTLTDAVPAVTITVTGLHDTTPATATPPGPLPIVTAGGANVIHYTADVTPPVITKVLLNT